MTSNFLLDWFSIFIGMFIIKQKNGLFAVFELIMIDFGRIKKFN